MADARLVLDLGNSRLKWGRLGPDGRLAASLATPVDDDGAWAAALAELAIAGPAAVATVNPPAADRLAAFLTDRGLNMIRWFRSAADVPVRHALEQPERTGADRALAVLAASRSMTGPGIVVQCGTAITVERIGPDGTWQGGAIAIGPALASRALRRGTAQLPEVSLPGPGEAPPAWGAQTIGALTAGAVWGAVGAVKELVARQAIGLGTPWVAWTGGDADVLAPLAAIEGSVTLRDAVLLGLAAAGFGERP